MTMFPVKPGVRQRILAEIKRQGRMPPLGSSRLRLPYMFDPAGMGNGPLPIPWVGATFAISSGMLINTPTFGADLITNGAFAADANWTKQTGWAISGGLATKTDGAASALFQSGVSVLGNWYRILWDIAAATAGNIKTSLGQSIMGPLHTTAGSIVETYRSNGVAPTAIYFWASIDFAGSLDNVSMYLLTTPTLFSMIATPETNVVVKLNIDALTEGAEVGAVVAMDNPVNPKYYVYATTWLGSVYLFKCINGVFTAMASAAFTFSAGKELKIVKSGTSYSVYYNSVQLGSTQVATDAMLDSNKWHGIISTHPSNQISRFKIAKTWSGSPRVALTFDDGWVSQITKAYPYMAARGITGTVFVTTSLIDTTADYMTSANLSTLNASGWVVGQHFQHHLVPGTDITSVADIQAEMQGAIDDLTGWGLNQYSNIVAPPGGGRTANSDTAMANLDIHQARSVGNPVSFWPYNAIPYQVGCSFVGSTVTLDTAKSWIDAAIANNAICVIGIHKIAVGDWTEAQFQGLIDYIVSVGIAPITIQEVFALISNS